MLEENNRKKQVSGLTQHACAETKGSVTQKTCLDRWWRCPSLLCATVVLPETGPCIRKRLVLTALEIGKPEVKGPAPEGPSCCVLPLMVGRNRREVREGRGQIILRLGAHSQDKRPTPEMGARPSWGAERVSSESPTLLHRGLRFSMVWTLGDTCETRQACRQWMASSHL